MLYDLMHKDTEVLRMNLNDDDGLIQSVESVSSIQHLPVGTFQNGRMNGRDLRNWWSKRSIPASRSGIRDILQRLDIPCTTALVTRCMGLSLSDQYWIRRADSDVEWKDVNFFTNEFSEDLGDLMFGHDKGSLDLNTPDNTSDGMLRKRWKIVDGKRCLIKSGSGTAFQEPFNEVIASTLMDALSIEHTDYGLIWSEGRPYSICPDFIDKDTELVTAASVINSYSSKKDTTYDRYVKACSSLGIDIVPYMDRMIVIDYIMANGDRHLNNFGLIRDAESLEFLGPAPIFDNGTSLGWDLLTREIPGRIGEKSKPFRKTFSEQLALVTDFGWIDFDALYGALEKVREILATEGFLDADRIEAVTGLLASRIDSLR